jgi:hypothetical protein
MRSTHGTTARNPRPLASAADLVHVARSSSDTRPGNATRAA